MALYSERFEGKVALVTGGVSGIGAAVSRRLLEEGAVVVAIDVSERAVNAFVDQHTSAGARLDARVLDVTDPVAVTAAVAATVEKHGRLDIVVNNAGIVAAGALGDVTDDDWRKVMSVDLDGVFHVSRAALPHLVASKGAIVNTASISGLAGDTGMAAYNAAKGAVVNLTRSLAVDYGHQGVRVNAIAPGPVATPMLIPVMEANETVGKTYAERIPLGRVARPDDIAAGILYLASEDASYITGVILPVDGGLTAWTAQPNLAAGL